MPRKLKPVRDSQVVMAHLMMPLHANLHGNVHGGTILSLVDNIATVCAMKHAEGKTVVTASVDTVLFRQPILVGQMVTMYASVNYVGRSSMEIGVKVVTEDMKTGMCTHTNSCYLTMVAIDDNRKTVEVPDLLCETEAEKKRFVAAEKRKVWRSTFKE